MEIILSGRKFGKLTVIALTEFYSPDGRQLYQCVCDCGNTAYAYAAQLFKSVGGKKSCGCKRLISSKEKSLPGRSHRLYRIYHKMKERCYNANRTEYPRYGGRGIIICQEWLNDFLNFYYWAMANGYQHNLTIDRRDNDGNYEPENCRWATQKVQSNNKRNNRLFEIRGVNLTMKQLSESLGVKYTAVRQRVDRGWPLDRILNTPFRQRECHIN